MPRKKATLKPISAPGQQYGQGVDAILAQKAIPLPNVAAQQAPNPAAAIPAGPPGGMIAPTGPPPITPLDAPSGNPDQHVMHGAPMGPGAGPEALNMNGAANPAAAATGNAAVLSQLKAIYSMVPTPGLGALIDSIQSNDYATGGQWGQGIGAPSRPGAA